jgi:uncharacterized protein YbjT (DUF2867 family)
VAAVAGGIAVIGGSGGLGEAVVRRLDVLRLFR